MSDNDLSPPRHPDSPVAHVSDRVTRLEADMHALKGSHEACFHLLQRKCEMLEDMMKGPGAHHPKPDLLFAHERAFVDTLESLEAGELEGAGVRLLQIIERLAPRPDKGG